MAYHRSVALILTGMLLVGLTACTSGAPFADDSTAGRIVQRLKVTEGVPVAIRETTRNIERGAGVDLIWEGSAHFASARNVLEELNMHCRSVPGLRQGVSSEHCVDDSGNLFATLTLKPGSEVPLYGKTPSGQNLRGEKMDGVAVVLELSE